MEDELKTFKTQAYMNDTTEQYCKRAFGVRRTIWNRALNQFLECKKQTNWLPSLYNLMKDYRANRDAQQPDGCFEWIAKQLISGRCAEETLKDIKAAFQLAKTQGKKLHKKNLHPKFKSKKDPLQTFSYYAAGPSVFRIDTDYTLTFECGSKQPRGVIHTRESLAFLKKEGVKLCRMTITCEAGKYYLAISYEKPNRKVAQAPAGTKAGIDLGIAISAVVFDGNAYSKGRFNTKASLKSDRLAKRNDKELSQKIYGSNRYNKALQLKQRRSKRAMLQRKALLEEFTTYLLRNYHEIVIDDFTFKGALSKADHEQAYRCMVYQFKLRLEQKAAEYGTVIRYVEHRKGIKTTHKCARCGSTAVIIGHDRVLHCKTCNYTRDRDYNAAENAFKL